MKQQRFSLKNGLQVILIDTQAFPTLTSLLLIGAGSRYETAKNNGISHFLEHMFYKGSQNYPNPYVISSTIEGMGGAWNAFTSKNYTGYYIKAANYHFDKVIDVISDILLRSFFKIEEITKEKGVIVEEINMYEDMPQAKVGELFENLLYKNYPLGFDVIGTKETVTSFNRETFIDYRKSLYHPNNAVLIVAGGFSQVQNSEFRMQNYLELIEEKFSGWNHGQPITYKKVVENQTKAELLVYNKKTEQAHFSLGFRTFGTKDDRKYILSVLATILGVGASSKLFMEVREKRGLCYYISTGRELYAEVGNLVTQAGVPKDINKITEAIRAVIVEHKKMAGGQISDDEMKKAKEILKGRLLLSMEDSFNVAQFFGMKQLLENSSETPEEVIAKLDRVKKEDVVNLSSQLFRPDNLNLAVIGPFDKEVQFRSVLEI